MNLKSKFNKINIIIGVTIAIIIFMLLAYFLGYRRVQGFKIAKIGYVTMTIPFSQTSIFLDQSERIITKKDNEVIKIPLTPKKHNIIVSRESYYPWNKDFVIVSNKVIQLSPIYVSQNPSGSIINQIDPEYYKIISQINKNVLPTNNKPKVSEDGLASIWEEEGSIMAKKEDELLQVIAPETEIKNIEFYKDRSDSLIFSTSDGIFMIEIDKKGQQNFMPIYKGTNPYFTKGNPNYIYVIDSNTLMQIVI